MKKFLFIALSTVLSTSLCTAFAETIKDKRDGQVYRILKLDDQEWIAENLRYSPKGAACTGICKKAGFMYTWHEAINACPEGWVLPSDLDWAHLFDYVPGMEDLVARSEVITRKYLNPKKTVNIKGRDAIAFGALTYGQCAELSDVGEKLMTLNCPIYWTSKDDKDDLSPISTDPSMGLTVAGDGHVAYALYGYIDRNYRNIAALKKERLPVRCISAKTTRKDPAAANKELLQNGLKDPRDRQVYNVALIGNKIWMTDNLNFITPNSWCYDNDKANCRLNGRLYTWAAAMNKKESECGHGEDCRKGDQSQVQGICPDGWHLPSIDEFTQLSQLAGGELKCEGGDLTNGICWHEGAAQKLHNNWDPRWPTTDAIGFNAQPGGTREDGGNFVGAGDYGFYWTSDEFHKNYGRYAWIDPFNFYLNYYFKESAFSVRCVKND